MHIYIYKVEQVAEKLKQIPQPVLAGLGIATGVRCPGTGASRHHGGQNGAPLETHQPQRHLWYRGVRGGALDWAPMMPMEATKVPAWKTQEKLQRL